MSPTAFIYFSSHGHSDATGGEAVLRHTWLEAAKFPRELDLKPGLLDQYLDLDQYLEVINSDPASKCFYTSVDLNNPNILATGGLAPSEKSPQFYQQMVYAVSMATTSNFEKALVRKALWSRRDWNAPLNKRSVLRLRICPHAIREANTYYSPEKKALLFGCFPAVLSDDKQPSENLPGSQVFTCLPHDVIAHETTHALLEGLHRYYTFGTSPDSLAFHEAFNDIMAPSYYFVLYSYSDNCIFKIHRHPSEERSRRQECFQKRWAQLPVRVAPFVPETAPHSLRRPEAVRGSRGYFVTHHSRTSEDLLAVDAPGGLTRVLVTFGDPATQTSADQTPGGSVPRLVSQFDQWLLYTSRQLVALQR
jgi:hypothetical protein